MYTLKDFITDSPVEELEILACPTDPAAVSIASVSVQELPLEDFILENELILSTAIGCLDSSDLLKQFVRAVRDSGSSALILTFKDPDYRLPPDVAVYANDIGLPLLRIPWRVRFADVIHFVSKKVHDKNLEIYKRVQDSLFTAYFNSQPLGAAAQILYRFLGCPVAIAGKDGAIRATYPLGSGGESYETLEIRINTFLWGYLHIYEPERCAIPASGRELLEKYVSSPLSLWFNQENVENMTVLKMKSDFVWNLANKNYTSFQEMARQGKKLGFNLYKPHMCIALRVCPRDTRDLLDEYSPRAAELTAAIETLLLTERNRLGQNMMFAERGLLFAIYVEVLSGTAEDSLSRIVRAVDEQFHNQYPDLLLYWGGSEVSRSDTPDFPRLYQTASLALQYCINSKDETHVFTYRDSRFHQVVTELSGNERIRVIAEETLSKLVEYEKTSSMDLMKTLTEFIKSNYNTSLTARNLHLNRQSLLYRLKKIETLTQLSLSDRRDLLLLEIFTRIHSDY